jgi:mannose/fructose/N-acetylgalactosamine-specific phosphotransferase system component IIB
MITLFRLDERMIHGQIAAKWTGACGANRIVVASDKAATNEVIQKGLKMAAPSQVKVSIKKVDDAITLLNDPRCEPLKIMVIFTNVDDGIKLLSSVSGIPKVIVGNHGVLAKKREGQERKGYTNLIYCYDDEAEKFREFIKLGHQKNIDVVFQTVPEDNPVKLDKVFGVNN